MDMKRFLLYAIVIAALALAGCGGNGNGGMTTMPDPDPDPPQPRPMNVDLSSLAAGMMLGTAVTSQKIDPGMSYRSGQVVFTCPSGGSACTITVTAAGAATYDANGGAPTVANTPEAIAAHNAAAAAATKAAGTKLTAIQAEAAQAGGNDAGLGGGGGPNVLDEAVITYSLAIERSATATMVTITDTNTAFDGPDEPKFTKAMDLGTANGFAGSMHVRVNSDNDDGKVEEVVVVRTDIDAPKATPFAMVTGQDLTEDLDLNTDADDDGDASNDFTAIAVVAGDSDVNLPKIKSSHFTLTPGRPNQLTFTFDESTTADDDEAFEGQGTYNGAMGTYRCNGTANCTVTLGDDGMITAVGPGWVFTPDSGATSDVLDTAYLYYGFWLKKTTTDGATTYNEVDTYFGTQGTPATRIGNDDDPDPALSGIGLVTGTADYQGNATGVYAKNVYDDQGGITSATSGVFSALVNLTATFGGGDIPVPKRGSIEGTVTDFALEHGEENDWSVTLQGADFVTRANPDSDAPTLVNWSSLFAGATEGDSGKDAGTWNGVFYGPAAVAHADATQNAVPTAPGAVLGEFDANFTDGAVAGAFGAKKQ